jgi:succinate-semialdehyde dehydrogenase/glutarate-semialdehyde dehydrogenase
MSAPTKSAWVTAEQERELLDRIPTSLLIGDWRDAKEDRRFKVEDPATGQVIAEIADGDAEDGLDALEIAIEAGAEWARTTPRERSQVLSRAADLMRERTDELSLLITLEMGKPLAEARGEVAYGTSYVQWYAEEAVRMNGRVQTNPDGGWRIMTTTEPVGSCLLITPWNFPLAMGMRKLAPALAAGCSAILKPAALTPLTSLYAAQMMLEAGLPPGLFNVVTTTSPGQLSSALMSDRRLRKVSFTGSTGVGAKLLEQGASTVMRSSMELGGNAPLVVFEDADIENAAKQALIAKLRNGGESCVAANRILVQDSIAEEFTERFCELMAETVVGRGTEPGVTLGPMIDPKAAAAINELVDQTVSDGARVRYRGECPDEPDSFVAPIVLDEIEADSRILREEIFGPVAPIVRFADEAQAVELANQTEYGLAAYLFSRDLDRCSRVADSLESGMVGINQGIVSSAAAPFGGIKLSGLGREGGGEGGAEYLNQKYIAISQEL